MSLDMPERLTGKYLVYGILDFSLLESMEVSSMPDWIVIMLFLNRQSIEFVKTNATKVMVVMIYSSVALALFAYNGAVDWKLDFNGYRTLYWGLVGKPMVSKKGDRVIRIAMLVTIFIMAVKLWFFVT